VTDSAPAASAAVSPNVIPAISVCVPTYNAGPYLDETLTSVLRQTRSDWELVIVDDASTDATLERAKLFAASDPRVRVLCNEHNLGPGPTWDRAVRSARGRYVKLLCQDDVLYRDCLASQAAVLDDPANSGVALVCAARDVIDESGRIILRGRPRAGVGRVAGPEALRRVARYGSNPLGEPVAVLFRAEAYARAGGFAVSDKWPYMIDVDLWTRLLLAGEDLFSLPQSLGAFRVSRGAMSTALAASQSRQARQFFEDLARRAPHAVRRRDLLAGRVRGRGLGVARRLLYAWMWGGRGGGVNPGAPAGGRH
jgi:glycosyltransferase involved in cell wall biosynthesis